MQRVLLRIPNYWILNIPFTVTARGGCLSAKSANTLSTANHSGGLSVAEKCDKILHKAIKLPLFLFLMSKYIFKREFYVMSMCDLWFWFVQMPWIVSLLTSVSINIKMYKLSANVSFLYYSEQIIQFWLRPETEIYRGTWRRIYSIIFCSFSACST